MKKFLKLSFIFFAILTIMAFAIDNIIQHNLRKSKSNLFDVWNDIYDSNINSDVIIMGNSRAYVQFNPYILDSILKTNSYNMGIDGRSVDTQILRYNVYRKNNNKKPKYILYSIDLSTLKLSNNYQKEQFLPYLSDDYLWDSIHEKEKFTWADRYLPCYKYTGYLHVIKEGICTKSTQHLYKGFQANNSIWNGNDLAKIKSLNYDNDTTAQKIFNNFLQTCKNDNIKVIFVYAPIYIDATKKIIDLNGMFNMYSNFAIKYNIPILDYTYDSICYDTSYFYNALHLNKTGADLFSTKLAHDLDSLGIIE